MSEDQWQQILERKRGGESVKSLCAAFGLRKSSIYARLRLAGITANHGTERNRRQPSERTRQYSEAEISEAMAAGRRSLWRYFDHPEFEDILGQAYLEMWRKLCELLAADRGSIIGLAVKACHHGALHYLASPAARYRRYNHEGQELPWIENLEALLAERGEAGDSAAFLPVVPDFAPELIERLWVLDLWERGAARLTETEREVVGRTVFTGETPEEVAADYGLSRERIYQIRQKVLNHFRRDLGLPLRNDGNQREGS